MQKDKEFSPLYHSLLELLMMQLEIVHSNWLIDNCAPHESVLYYTCN